MKPSKKDIMKWIEALRSGKYKQGKGYLQTVNGFCCLGVACKVLVPEYEKDGDGTLLGGLPQEISGSPKWLSKINMHFHRISYVGSLTNLNDKNGFSFDEIADSIQLVYIEGALDEK